MAASETVASERRRELRSGFLLSPTTDPGGLALALSLPSLRARLFQSPSPDRGSDGAQTKQKMQIAVVEDEQDLLNLYATYFKGIGYETVSTFINGEELVSAVSQGTVSPDLVVMDYRLPGQDGIETAKRLAAIKPEMKVIITTADDSVKQQAEVLGFMFLQKPFYLTQLRRMVETS